MDRRSRNVSLSQFKVFSGFRCPSRLQQCCISCPWELRQEEPELETNLGYIRYFLSPTPKGGVIFVHIIADQEGMRHTGSLLVKLGAKLKLHPFPLGQGLESQYLCLWFLWSQGGWYARSQRQMPLLDCLLQ